MSQSLDSFIQSTIDDPDILRTWQIDFDLIDREAAQGYISVQENDCGQRIYNYTSKAQFEWRWNVATMTCRGLIVDANDQVICRPFPKFFSYDQVGQQIPDGSFTAFEKLDGSLGILYWADDVPKIATRGSFDSPQAQRATKLLSKYDLNWLRRDRTYLFEIIYPENRIVVDYGGQEDLILLGIIETQTGREEELPEDIELPQVKRYDGIQEFDEILRQQGSNREGFVIRFDQGTRLKVKFEDYQRLHKLVTGIGPAQIWDLLRSGQGLEELIERVPDEFYGWVKEIESGLRSRFREVATHTKSQFRSDFPTRKETAEYFKSCDFPSIMFAMLDGKEYEDMIWRAIKPTGETFFKSDRDH